MLPLQLEIRNFLAYRSPDPVRFEGIHLACLTGANGAGKSSLLDAITWVLWGKARARRDPELVHLGQSDMSVQLDFEQEGTIYRVIRRHARRGGGQGELTLHARLDDGGWNQINAGSIRATQDQINRLLRLEYETFVHSAFLQQGKADAFTTRTPKERKQILSDILGLDRWEVYEKLAKEQIAAIDADISVIQMGIRERDAEIAREPEYERQLADARTAEEEAQRALTIAEERVRELDGARAELNAAEAQKAAVERRLNSYQTDLHDVALEIARLEERVRSFEATVASREQIEAGYARLQEARSEDTALGSKLMQLNDVDNSRRSLEKQIDEARGALEREISGLEAEIREKQRIAAAATPDDLAQAQDDLRRAEAVEQERSQLLELISTLEQERSRLSAQNEGLRVEMDTLKDRLDRLMAVEGALCPLCGQPLSEENRQTLIADCERDGRLRGDTFRRNRSRLDEIADLVRKHRDRSEDLIVEVRKLNALRERAGRLEKAAEDAHHAETALMELEARRAALERAIAEDDYAHELRAQLAALDAQREALGYDRARHDSAREDVAAYAQYEKRQTELELALKSLPQDQEMLAGAAARRERLQAAQAEGQEELTSVIARIEALRLKVTEWQARVDEERRYRLQYTQARDRRTSAEQTLRSIDDSRRRRQDLEARLTTQRETLAVYAQLREAFGKNGIPAMVIETAIPELETDANRLLARMTDGRFSLRLSTQREKVTGGLSETLEIKISDDLGERSYEMFSGGEAFRINFALRVALSRLLARRAGAQLRTLFIDEGFGTQDEDGRNKLIEAITAIQDDFDMILIITHLEDLRDSFPVHILVEKRGDGSFISIR